MNLKQFTFKGKDGRYYINEWICYFPEIKKSNKYYTVDTSFAPIKFEYGRCYLLDENYEEIWDSSIAIKDLEILGDIVDQLMLKYMHIPYKQKNWIGIGEEAIRIFRQRQRRADEEKAREERKRKQKELEAKEELQAPNKPIYIVKSGKEWVKEGRSMKERRNLWMNLWREGEICVMFADTNVGKSIYAIQMGFEIAKREKVLYFDYEMDAKTFQLRYTDERGEYPIPDNFIRIQPRIEMLGEKDSEKMLISEIELIVRNTGAKVLIIDNLTFLSEKSQSSVGAQVLTYQLKKLQERQDLSMLLLAHTPKLKRNQPLSKNDLAGSKKIINFVDSSFAIGQSIVNHRLQYIKQLKARNGEILYGSDNVILVEKKFSDHWLHFETVGYDQEQKHLQDRRFGKTEIDLNEVKSLQDMGFNKKEIGEMMGVNRNTVRRRIKEAMERGEY